MFQSEIQFKLPKGYLDEDGKVHNEGIMRLATGADEIVPQKDPRVGKNPAYLVFILLSRVIIKLGDLKHITTKVIENLFIEDLTYLENMYNEINGHKGKDTVECPECHKSIVIEDNRLGG